MDFVRRTLLHGLKARAQGGLTASLGFVTVETRGPLREEKWMPEEERLSWGCTPKEVRLLGTEQEERTGLRGRRRWSEIGDVAGE